MIVRKMNAKINGSRTRTAALKLPAFNYVIGAWKIEFTWLIAFGLTVGNQSFRLKWWDSDFEVSSLLRERQSGVVRSEG